MDWERLVAIVSLCNLYTAGVTSVQANVWFYQSPPYCFKIGWLKGWVQFSPSSCWIHTRRFFKFRNWREHTPDNRLKTVDDIQEELAMLAFAIVLSQIWNSASCSFLLEDSPRFAFATMASVMITWFTFLYKCSFSHVGRYNVKSSWLPIGYRLSHVTNNCLRPPPLLSGFPHSTGSRKYWTRLMFQFSKQWGSQHTPHHRIILKKIKHW